jgi:hypothetical protein
MSDREEPELCEIDCAHLVAPQFHCRSLTAKTMRTMLKELINCRPATLQSFETGATIDVPMFSR